MLALCTGVNFCLIPSAKTIKKKKHCLLCNNFLARMKYSVNKPTEHKLLYKIVSKHHSFITCFDILCVEIELKSVAKTLD